MVALATHPLLWCHFLTTLSLGFQKSIFCHFDLGIDWPVRPLMQVDKGVASQFLLALTYNLHETSVNLCHGLSTGG